MLDGPTAWTDASWVATLTGSRDTWMVDSAPAMCEVLVTIARAPSALACESDWPWVSAVSSTTFAEATYIGRSLTWMPYPAASPSRAKASTRRQWIRRTRSEEHTSELQSPCNLVCRLLLEK